MASAAALQGIQKYGHSWRAQIRIRLPENIPALFEQCETNRDAISLTNEIATNLTLDLERHPKLPADAIPQLNNWIENFTMAFVVDDIDTAAEFVVDDLGADLVTAINDLYDWADYYRVLLSPIR